MGLDDLEHACGEIEEHTCSSDPRESVFCRRLHDRWTQPISVWGSLTASSRGREILLTTRRIDITYLGGRFEACDDDDAYCQVLLQLLSAPLQPQHLSIVGKCQLKATGLCGWQHVIDLGRLASLHYSWLPPKPILDLLASWRPQALTKLQIDVQGGQRKLSDTGLAWRPGLNYFPKLLHLKFHAACDEHAPHYLGLILAMIDAAPTLRYLDINGYDVAAKRVILRRAGSKITKLDIPTWRNEYMPLLPHLTHLKAGSIDVQQFAHATMWLADTVQMLTLGGYGASCPVSPMRGNWSERRADYPGLQTVKIEEQYHHIIDERSRLEDSFRSAHSMAVICEYHGISFEDKDGKKLVAKDFEILPRPTSDR